MSLSQGATVFCIQRLSDKGWDCIADNLNLLEARAKATLWSQEHAAAFRVVSLDQSDMQFLCRDGVILVDLSEPADLAAALEGQPSVLMEDISWKILAEAN
ncbi:hypothetical protein [Synechococcus sp. BIOS-E4-1]|uniref:hypothetical protein n=1 Tax=Synechococcus sp. BIOS-E4-1 TaxID=1400864 RepID=UPI0016482754|nr:hypothetical protein [Synechococcus sp. BIOS-E4-1]